PLIGAERGGLIMLPIAVARLHDLIRDRLRSVRGFSDDPVGLLAGAGEPILPGRRQRAGILDEQKGRRQDRYHRCFCSAGSIRVVRGPEAGLRGSCPTVSPPWRRPAPPTTASCEA